MKQIISLLEIERNADMVVGLYQPKNTDISKIVYFRVVKSRNKPLTRGVDGPETIFTIENALGQFSELP